MVERRNSVASSILSNRFSTPFAPEVNLEDGLLGTRMVPRIPDAKRSFSHHVTLINDFILNKAKLRADIINQKRAAFGIYLDCFGLGRRSVYFGYKERGILSVRYSPNGKRVVVGYGSGTIKVYSTVVEEEEITVLQGKENGYSITCIRFPRNNNDEFFASTGEGLVFYYNIKNDGLSAVVRQPRYCEINAIDINFNNVNLLTASSSLAIKLYDMNTMALLSVYKNVRKGSEYTFPEFHKNRVFAVKFLPDDSNIFLSGGWDNHLKLWDLRVKFGIVKSIEGPHISGDAIDVKQNCILTGSWEPKNSLHLYDLRKFELIKYIVPINSPKSIEGVYTFAASFYHSDKSGDLILRASLGHKSVDVISISNNVVLHSFVSERSCVCFDSYETNIVFGGTHNALRFVSFFPNLLVENKYRSRWEDGQESVSDIEIEVGEEEAVEEGSLDLIP